MQGEAMAEIMRKAVERDEENNDVETQ